MRPATGLLPAPATRFVLPPEREAASPPEWRGVARDEVRLLVARPDGLDHHRFRDLPDLLDPGDLVVVNTSATLPAALDVRRPDGSAMVLHVSTELADGSWVVEARRPDGRGPDRTVRRGDRFALPGGVGLRLADPYPHRRVEASRLWVAAATPEVARVAYLHAHGRPIAYGYLAGRFPLADYQTVYATEPGSAEMASAGRPFTVPLLVRLVARGVTVAPLVLHAGVSSPEVHEPPLPEHYTVPAATARLVASTRSTGGRVVAVGTTVVRALESCADLDGSVHATSGWTDLVLGPDRPSRVVTGLISGLHAPEASHLLLLEAVAGRRLVGEAYAAVGQEDYLWHEFGDSMLFLP